jgi:YHS domain-containing protein
MKKIFATLFPALVLLAALASAAADKPAPRPALKCPVTKLSIASPSVAVAKSVYHGRTYFFCTSHCKTLFDKAPKRYLKP